MPREYKYGRSIFKRIARELNKPVSYVKYEFMRNVTAAAKELVKEKYGGNFKTGWLPALSEVLPVAYQILATGKIPTVVDILEKLRGK
jgi:hypothetical protein